MKRVLVLAALVLTAPVEAQAFIAVAGPGSYAYGFATPVVVTTEGRQATFTNLDVAVHDVVASEHFRTDGSKPWCAQYAGGRCPLFRSPLARAGETVPVEGSEEA